MTQAVDPLGPETLTAELDSAAALERATKQLQDYARSNDFESPPPFLFLYCGKPDRNRFFRLRTVAEGSLLATTSNRA
ncbi:MAG: hypothetical protein U0R69_08980 [Gaiellales bacterium]